MRCSLLPLVFLLSSPLAGQGLPPDHDLAALESKVAAVLAERCGRCHASTVENPKGKFGYSDDLSRVAEAFLSPGKPDESKLWTRMTETEKPMPPKISRSGALTLEELSVVRWWVVAKTGLLGTATASASDALPSGKPEEPRTLPTPSPGFWPAAVLRFGPIHPLIVHFPIALLLVAALLEIPRLVTTRRQSAPATTVCLVLGASTAILSAILGLILEETAGTPGETLDRHRWSGLAAAGLSVSTWLAFVWARRGASARRWLVARCLLLLAAATVALAGHLGGILVYGEDPIRTLLSGS